MYFLYRKAIRSSYLNSNLGLAVLAVLLLLSLVLAGCEPNNDLPDPPLDNTGQGGLEAMKACGTPKIEILSPNEEQLTSQGIVRFTCDEAIEGSCGVGNCEPCWKQEPDNTGAMIFALKCVCDGTCNSGGGNTFPNPGRISN